MTRTRTALTLTTLGLAGLLALTGCGAAAGSPAAGVADEAVALQTVGLETGLSAAPGPSAAPDPSAAGERRPGVRKFLRKNTLHGEITVQGKDGVRTVVVQRGTVTAADATTVSVKSTDGFTQTWTLGDKLRVVQNRAAADRAAVKTGAVVGVAGAKTGDTTTARLIVVQ
jgi:hypothetical protein